MIGAICGLVALVWIGLAWVPGGPDSPLADAAVGVGVAIALTLTAVSRHTSPRWRRSRAGADAVPLVLLCTFVGLADLATLLVGLATADARIGLIALAPAAFVGLLLAGLLRARVLAGHTIATVLVVLAVTAAGVVNGQRLTDLLPYAVQTLAMIVLLPIVLHYCLAQLGPRTTTRKGEPMRDSLTEVLTRHGLYTAASTSLSALNRKDHLVVVLVHLDQFDDIAIGDGRERSEQVLKRVADRLAQGVRGGDFVARTGDSEFSALAGVTLEGVEIFANRFRDMVFDVADPVPVSASVGVAFVRTPVAIAEVEVAVDNLLSRAGAAMEVARAAGGDRVEIDWTVPERLTTNGR